MLSSLECLVKQTCQTPLQGATGSSWQLLSELAEKSVEPHAALFENLVDLVALPPAAQ